MEFPRVVYFGIQTPGEWVCQVVADEAACDQALRDGWTLLPTFAAPDVPVPEPEPSPEPEKRKPGRPRKAV